MGSEETGQTNAIWYTLIESCRRRKIDPWTYLVWIFEELPGIKVTAATFAQHTPAAYAEKLRPRQHAKKSGVVVNVVGSTPATLTTRGAS